METALDRIISNPPGVSTRATARIVLLLLVAFLVWAASAKLQEVAVAEGEVVPQEKVQAIQHLEGGIIEKIHVREGDRVSEGQELLQLNLTSFTSTKHEMEINLQGLLLKQERLTAESKGEPTLIFSDAVKDFRPELIQSEQQAFEGGRLKLESGISVLREQVQQKELDIKSLTEEKASIGRNLMVLKEKLNISADLMQDQLTSKLDHLQLKSEVEELEGKLSTISVAIPRAQGILQEARERLHNENLSFRNAALAELTQVGVDIARTREALEQASDQVLRTAIKSPISGTVKSLSTHTIGGVVKPGEMIMEIVPDSEDLDIQARLDPNDIGFVKVGQDVLVKVLTYDYARYGGLDGKVVSISPDTHLDQKTGDAYFEVTIRTDKNYLGAEKGMMPITAGMQTTADIQTGKKSVMEYLLKPIVTVKEEAFRER